MVTKKITPEDIINIVAEATGIPSKEFKKRSRKANLVDARRICAVLIREYLKVPFGKIAIQLGMEYGHHDTIMYYIKSSTPLMEYDAKFADSLSKAENAVMAQLAGYKSTEPEVSSASKFVNTILDNIVWEERGTTRENMYALYYKLNSKE